jgi:hypothetical protein
MIDTFAKTPKISFKIPQNAITNVSIIYPLKIYFICHSIQAAQSITHD